MAPNSAELKALYHRCDIFCLPTRADALGLVLVEASAAGLPVVSTSVGATAEIVKDGQTGIMVPPGDVAALVHALSALIADPVRRRQLGDAARALVLESYDAAKNSSAIVDLMIDVAGERS
jgi:glycosyltransferase involved in cell wall biosynthesis